MSIDTMPHQLKRIENGRHDVWWLLLDTWKSFWEQSDEISDSVYYHGHEQLQEYELS